MKKTISKTTNSISLLPEIVEIVLKDVNGRKREKPPKKNKNAKYYGKDRQGWYIM